MILRLKDHRARIILGYAGHPARKVRARGWGWWRETCGNGWSVGLVCGFSVALVYWHLGMEHA